MKMHVVVAAALMMGMSVLPAVAAEYPSLKQAEIAHTANYVGGDACKKCHGEIHGKLQSSWHSLKATQGPAMGKQYEKNIYEWVRRDWDKLDSYLLLDQKDKTTNYVMTRKIKPEEVGYVVGQVRKQRYLAYYDGGPTEAWLQTTKDGGISWTIDKSQTVQFAGNKDRAGWKFLTLEMKPKDGQMNKNYYGEYRSWQERCIGCHTTGFDNKAWDAAKADFKAGTRKDLKDIFVADLRVSCEMCHGPGGVHVKSPSKENIIQPTKMTDPEARQMVCTQCHTRPDKNNQSPLAQDLRGYRLGDKYSDFASYTRPAWGKGNRQVSLDGKGRRDHQMDMDIKLSSTIKGDHSVHASMACFDCHDAHNIGNNKENPRLTKSRVETCAACHKGKAEAVLKVLDGQKGWEKPAYPNWATEFGRGGSNQHIFNVDEQGRSAGLKPSQYHWALKKDGNAKNEADWLAIWPWEKAGCEKKEMKTFIGAKPWEM